MPDRGHTPGEQEREWTIYVCPEHGVFRVRVAALASSCSCATCGGPLVEIVVVPKADDVTDNYMVAVSRLKAERDSLQAQVDEARKALEAIRAYIDSDEPEKHRRMGEACGVDACVLCLAAGTAYQALLALPPPTEGT